MKTDQRFDDLLKPQEVVRAKFLFLSLRAVGMETISPAQAHQAAKRNEHLSKVIYFIIWLKN